MKGFLGVSALSIGRLGATRSLGASLSWKLYEFVNACHYRATPGFRNSRVPSGGSSACSPTLHRQEAQPAGLCPGEAERGRRQLGGDGRADLAAGVSEADCTWSGTTRQASVAMTGAFRQLSHLHLSCSLTHRFTS